MINTKCPYCGSHEIVADIDIRITGKLDESGKITPMKYWKENELDLAIGESSEADIYGFCEKCGSYCDFTWKDGFINTVKPC